MTVALTFVKMLSRTQGLQKFIGQADWDHQPLLTTLARPVGTELGQDDGALVFDPSAF